MLQGGQILAGRYVLLRKLGEGRATQVWQARDREAGTDRVLKILTTAEPAARDRFVAAARLQQQFVHPNLQACEAVDDGEPAFAVFARVARSDLAGWRGRPWPQLLPVLAGIAAGLSALHQRGLVHRDLKPANVLVGDDGAPMLADFGLAAAAGDADAQRGGSPFSMSPQQLDGVPPEPADDIYAFGALAYELLGGYPPFYPDARAERVRTEVPAALPARAGVPPSLEQLVLGCLAKDPHARPVRAADLAAELRAMAAAAPATPGAAAAAGVELRPPPSSEPTIDPQWTRTAPSGGPTPEQLRSQGFRRGLIAASFAFLMLAAAFVFFVLPQRVERAATATPATDSVPEPAAAASPAEAPDLQQLAEAKREFEELRPAVTTRLEGLEARAAGEWGGERSRAASACSPRPMPRSDGATTGRHLHTCAQSTPTSSQPSSRRPCSCAPRSTPRQPRSTSGDATVARKQFERALAIDPGNAVARRGLERAGTLHEVRRLLAEAASLEEQGQTTGAMTAYRKALELDRDTQAARRGAGAPGSRGDR
jgi:eukaryotic-like serine/threonine-protein kinase